MPKLCQLRSTDGAQRKAERGSHCIVLPGVGHVRCKLEFGLDVMFEPQLSLLVFHVL